MRKKPSQPTVETDGNLVYVMDDDIAPSTHICYGIGAAYFFNNQLGRFRIIPDDMLSRITQVEKMKQLNAPDIFIADLEQLCKKYRLQHPEIFEILAEGRLKVSFLLNSFGGKGTMRDMTVESAEHVKRRGGELFSFGGLNIISAAAELFVMPPAKRRYLLKNSELLFHMGSTAYMELTEDFLSEHYPFICSEGEMSEEEFAEQEKRDQEEEKSKDMAHLRQLILRSTPVSNKEKVNGIINKAFDDPANIDKAITFTGDEAAKLGLANRVTPESLAGEFNKANNVDKSAYEGTKIEEFFREIKIKNAAKIFLGYLIECG